MCVFLCETGYPTRDGSVCCRAGAHPGPTRRTSNRTGGLTSARNEPDAPGKTGRKGHAARERPRHGAGGLASLPPARPLLLIYIALLRVLLHVLAAGLHSGRSSEPRIPGRTKKTTARLAERMNGCQAGDEDLCVRVLPICKKNEVDDRTPVFHDETASG